MRRAIAASADSPRPVRTSCTPPNPSARSTVTPAARRATARSLPVTPTVEADQHLAGHRSPAASGAGAVELLSKGAALAAGAATARPAAARATASLVGGSARGGLAGAALLGGRGEQRVMMLGLERLRITSVLYWVLNFGLVIVASIREPAGYLRRWSLSGSLLGRPPDQTWCALSLPLQRPPFFVRQTTETREPFGMFLSCRSLNTDTRVGFLASSNEMYGRGPLAGGGGGGGGGETTV